MKKIILFLGFIFLVSIAFGQTTVRSLKVGADTSRSAKLDTIIVVNTDELEIYNGITPLKYRRISAPFFVDATSVTTNGPEFNLLDGALWSTAEGNFLVGVTSTLQPQMDAKAPIASPTLTGTPASVTAAQGTNTTQIATTAYVRNEIANGDDIGDVAVLKADSGVYDGGYITPTGMNVDIQIAGTQAMGSNYKAFNIGGGVTAIGSSSAYTDRRLFISAVYLQTGETLTGVHTPISAQGDYTAEDYNGVGLYSESGGTITLVASSTDDGNIWKAAANSMITKAFSSTYVATAGLYYVAVLYNQSAQTTAPTYFKLDNGNSMIFAATFTDDNILGGYKDAISTLPASVALNTFTNGGLAPWVALY